jgi:hypothetical protein
MQLSVLFYSIINNGVIGVDFSTGGPKILGCEDA